MSQAEKEHSVSVSLLPLAFSNKHSELSSADGLLRNWLFHSSLLTTGEEIMHHYSNLFYITEEASIIWTENMFIYYLYFPIDGLFF
jgi:hypothetical protein